MKIKPNYILISLFTVAVALIGSYFTNQGLNGWYQEINLPAWTPPGSVIGAVWTVLYILATVSALIVWNRFARDPRFWTIIALFILNGILNFTWSYLFFDVNLIVWAIVDSVLLLFTVVALIILIAPKSKLAAGLLVPYALWVAFATVLTHSVWRLNI
jgi:translocator protein